MTKSRKAKTEMGCMLHSHFQLQVDEPSLKEANG